MLYSYFFKEKKLFDLISNIYATEVERIPEIKNPVKLIGHDSLKEKCNLEVVKIGEGKDRLNKNNLVGYKVVRYLKK